MKTTRDKVEESLLITILNTTGAERWLAVSTYKEFAAGEYDASVAESQRMHSKREHNEPIG